MERTLVSNFLQDEYNVQKEEYSRTLHTNCGNLIEKGEALFRGKIFKISPKEIFIKFSSSRALPRINSGSYICFLLLKGDRDKDKVNSISFLELISKATYSFELRPAVYIKDRDTPNFTNGIFSSFEENVPEKIASYNNSIVYIGIEPPPLEMLLHLKKYMSYGRKNPILEPQYEDMPLLDTRIVENSPEDFILDKLNLGEFPIIQGPPGSGKSYLISSIVDRLCRDNKSVLIVSMTNQALMEIAVKKPLNRLIISNRVFKTSLKTNELSKLSNLEKLNDISPINGCLHLATFYKASEVLENELCLTYKYDYVFVDEASECTLPMLSMVCELGKKFAFFGDICQLPPVVVLNDDKIKIRKYTNIVNGLSSISKLYQTYQLQFTYRLPAFSALCTSSFYKHPILSKSKLNKELLLTIKKQKLSIPPGTFIFFVCMDGSQPPKSALDLICEITSQIVQYDKNADIALLSHLKSTMRATYSAIVNAQNINSKDNILIETVHRIQGLTTDFAIFTIPNYRKFKLDQNLLNVATSRGRQNNFIIMDKGLESYIKHNSPKSNIHNFIQTVLFNNMFIEL